MEKYKLKVTGYKLRLSGLNGDEGPQELTSIEKSITDLLPVLVHFLEKGYYVSVTPIEEVVKDEPQL